MKVLLINGSPRQDGCTYTALREAADALERAGIETEIFWIGARKIAGCIGCRKCLETGYCIFDDDPANDCIDALKRADGVIAGSPVYYAGPSGALCSLLERVFYLKSEPYALKPAASVVSCRRGGASAAFDRLNKYFALASMPIVTSQYWNSVHGNTPEEVKQDLEGMQTMRTLGKNMAWLLKCIKHAEGAVPPPEKEKPERTSFIR